MTSAGFDGTVNESQFAWMFALGGVDAVADDAAWKVSQGTGRQVTVAGNGYAFAKGVLSYNEGTRTAALSTPTNGQWNLIVRRIDWTTNTVSVVALPHTTTSTTTPTISQVPATYPATLQATPGATYDQLLAWAWVNSANTTVTIFDLRDLPLVHHDSGWVVPPAFNSGWTNHDGALDPVRIRVRDGFLILSGRVAKTAGAGTVIFTLPAGFRPARLAICASPHDQGVGSLWVGSDGRVEYLGSTGLALTSVSLTIPPLPIA